MATPSRVAGRSSEITGCVADLAADVLGSGKAAPVVPDAKRARGSSSRGVRPAPARSGAVGKITGCGLCQARAVGHCG